MRILEFFRPFRLVATRRVSEEEQVSVEAFCKTTDEASSRLETILGVFRDHRKRSNEEIVRATQQQLSALEAAIKARGDTAHELDEKIAKQRAEIEKLDQALRNRANRLAGSPLRPA